MEPELEADLKSLYRVGYGLLADQGQVRSLLESVASRRDVRAAPWLLPLAFSANRAIAHLARRCIATLLQDVAVHRLPAVEQSLRGSYQLGLEGLAYREFHPKVLSSADPHTLGVASAHHNGYVRQRACELLGIKGLRYLLLRANDWVPEIRNVASLLLMRLSKEDPAEWVRCLPLVERLRNCWRADHSPFVDYVSELLKQHPEAVEEGTKSESYRVRALAYKLADKAEELYLKALKDCNVGIRIWAVEDAVEHLEDPEDTLVAARHNKAPSVRYRALLQWRKRRPDDLCCFRNALVDKSRSVREYAQYVMRKQDFDLAAFYADRLGKYPQAILGLTELGEKPVEQAREQLSHPDYPFQKTALQVLAMLRRPLVDFEPSLLSEDARLSGRAARELSKVNFSRERLWLLWKENETAHVRENISRLLMNYGRWWERLIARIRVAREALPPLKDRAVERLSDRVCGGVYLPPDGAREYLRESLPFLREVLQPELVTELQTRFGIG